MLDTALAVQLKQAADLLIADLDELLDGAQAPRVRAQADPDHRPQPRHPRRADHASGSSWRRPMPSSPRNRERLVAARDDVATCAISGAVGTFANVPPEVEEHVAAELGLTPEPVSTQVIPRDRHAMFFATLGVIASSIERLATEIRHLQRTEVLEAEEYFSPGPEGQLGDAAQAQPGADRESDRPRADGPQRRRRRRWRMSRCGMSATSRTRRSSGSSAPTRRSRSISRSARLTGVVDKLLVYPERMQKNLDRMGGLVHSQRVLLALTQAGLSREDSYALVQRNAMKVWESDGAAVAARSAQGRPGRHRALSRRASSTRCSTSIITCKHVDTIFARVFGSAA